jgi:hypothetical protein
MGHLMGAVPQQLPAVNPGAAFQFGYNVGVLAGTFGSKIYDPTEIAAVIEAQGLSYNTNSYAVSGALNPYLTIEGNANTYWDSGSDFGNAIYNAISLAGYPIDFSSIQFRVEAAPGSSPAGGMVGTPYPNPNPNPNPPPGAPPPPGQCNFSSQGFGQWIACEMGLKDPITGALLGSAGTAIGIGVVALVAVLLIKK